MLDVIWRLEGRKTIWFSYDVLSLSRTNYSVLTEQQSKSLCLNFLKTYLTSSSKKREFDFVSLNHMFMRTLRQTAVFTLQGQSNRLSNINGRRTLRDIRVTC